MRLLLGAAAVCLLLVELTWLLLRGAGSDEPRYALALHAFDNVALAEASLNRDVLRARAGLLRNYDPLNRAIADMREAADQLTQHARIEALDTVLVERLTAMVDDQETLTEDFKSNNALLQNSLSYLSFLLTAPASGSVDGGFAPGAGALAAAVLRLTLDTSPVTAQDMQVRLNQIAAIPALGERDAEMIPALLPHVHLLQELLPSIDRTIRALLAVPSRESLAAIRAQFSERHAEIEAAAQRYRLLLYATSLLLLLALVDFGRRLQARAQALRQRAEFEHVIAENSTRLINFPPAETDARLGIVLSELGRAMGVDRAYIVLDASPPRVHSWSAEGINYPQGWPEGALAVLEEPAIARGEIATVPDVMLFPPGPHRAALLAAGVRGWACVPLQRPGRASGVMAFETVERPWDRRFPVPGLMRLAGDAVANAVEREFLERDRARLVGRLERARRMQTIGSLASGIAHNFNNIIGAIIGYAEMAEAQLAPSATALRHIEQIRRATERARGLVDGILTFGRRGDTQVRPLQARALLEEAAQLLRASLPKSIELAIGEVAPHLAVIGEPVQLQQVILNLCTNASHAMRGNGRIEVSTESIELADPLALSHGELAAGRYVRLAVSDTGVGFDEDIARQLFKPFFTTRFGGTGLGLATVREIITDHEGVMHVHSVPGQGSRFEAWLPEAPPQIDERPATGQGLLLPRGRGEAVLVVEKNRDRRLGDEETLAALGYEPIGFEEASEAIAACHENPRRFDAAVIGHAGPEESGLRLARSLRKALPGRPILLMTAPTNNIGLHELAEAGIVELLNRPLITTELAAALARCLRASASAGA